MPLDPRIDDALAAIEQAWRRYCHAANRRASDRVCADRWREYRRAQRAFHDVCVEVEHSQAGGSR